MVRLFLVPKRQNTYLKQLAVAMKKLEADLLKVLFRL